MLNLTFKLYWEITIYKLKKLERLVWIRNQNHRSWFQTIPVTIFYTIQFQFQFLNCGTDGSERNRRGTGLFKTKSAKNHTCSFKVSRLRGILGSWAHQLLKTKIRFKLIFGPLYIWYLNNQIVKSNSNYLTY